jgi:hypothetical protein
VVRGARGLVRWACPAAETRREQRVVARSAPRASHRFMSMTRWSMIPGPPVSKEKIKEVWEAATRASPPPPPTITTIRRGAACVTAQRDATWMLNTPLWNGPLVSLPPRPLTIQGSQGGCIRGYSCMWSKGSGALSCCWRETEPLVLYMRRAANSASSLEQHRVHRIASCP